MALTVVHDPVAAQHDARMAQGHIHVRLFHHIADSETLRLVPPHLVEDLLRAAPALVLALAQLHHVITAVVPLQPALVIGGGADGGGEGIVGVAVAADPQAVHAVRIHQAQELLHLAEARHGADVGNLHRQAQGLPHVQELPGRVKDLGGVAADVGGDQLVLRPADRRGPLQLPPVDARHVADAVGDAEAPPVQGLGNGRLHVLELLLADGGVLVQVAAGLPDIGVARQHRHVDGGAVPVDEVQVVAGVVLVQPALARQYCGDAHPQHAGEDGGGVVPNQAAVGSHRVLMHMDVHKAGRHNLSGGIDHLVGLRLLRRHGGHLAIPQQQVQLRLHLVPRVDHQAIPNQNTHK